MSDPGMLIAKLSFTGAGKKSAELPLSHGLNVIFGASNTGKSFAVKTIDFMFGGTRPLPDIEERIGYERVWMALKLPKSGDVTLMRALAGGALELHAGHVTDTEKEDKSIRRLSAKHNFANADNVSQFLLDELGFAGRQVATDVYGKKRPLSFRDLIRFCIVDETSIQSEISPAESGQYVSPTVERSVFKLLLTGQDDSAVVAIQDRRTFKTTTTAKIEVIDEMIKALEEELMADFPQSSELSEQNKRLEETWTRAQREVQLAQESIRAKLTEKQRLAQAIYNREQRRSEIQINFGRFEQLEDVYRSDIERLESIEEAGFVLALGGDKPCPLCGASPDAQKHVHGLSDIKKARDAASIEIEKIKRQQAELQATIQQLDVE